MRLWNGYRFIEHVEPNGFSVRDGVPLIFGRKRVSAPPVRMVIEPGESLSVRLEAVNAPSGWASGASFRVGGEPEKEP